MSHTAARPLATPEQVCEWLQITIEQLDGLHKRKAAPRSIKVSRTERRYSWADVHAWARERMDEDHGQ